MDWKTIAGLIARHTLTYVAGVLVAHGYLQSSATEGFVGAGMLFAGVAWSWWQKSGQAEMADELAAWEERWRRTKRGDVALAGAKLQNAQAAVPTQAPGGKP
jgi:hypothetical protein